MHLSVPDQSGHDLRPVERFNTMLEQAIQLKTWRVIFLIEYMMSLMAPS